MPTIDELHAADKRHAAALAALEARVSGHDTMLSEIRAHMSKQDEAIGQIRETLGGLATKGDILNLSQQITAFNQQQLIAAQHSLSPKMAAWAGVGTLILAALGFAASHFK